MCFSMRFLKIPAPQIISLLSVGFVSISCAPPDSTTSGGSSVSADAVATQSLPQTPLNRYRLMSDVASKQGELSTECFESFQGQFVDKLDSRILKFEQGEENSKPVLKMEVWAAPPVYRSTSQSDPNVGERSDWTHKATETFTVGWTPSEQAGKEYRQIYTFCEGDTLVQVEVSVGNTREDKLLYVAYDHIFMSVDAQGNYNKNYARDLLWTDFGLKLLEQDHNPDQGPFQFKGQLLETPAAAENLNSVDMKYFYGLPQLTPTTQQVSNENSNMLWGFKQDVSLPAPGEESTFVYKPHKTNSGESETTEVETTEGKSVQKTLDPSPMPF